MSGMNASVTVDLAGNLIRRARQHGQALENFSKRGSRSLNVVKRSAHLAGKGLDKMANRWTGMITGAAGAATVKMLVGLDERMTRLGIQANRSAGEMDTLKKAIFETAQLPEIRVDSSQIIGAIEEIIEKTGDLKFAEDNLKNIAMAIQATGTQGSAIGSITAEFQKMGIVSKKEVKEALEILTVQGKEGAFTLQNLAVLGSRTVTAYTSMGRTGVPAIREMGAALQVIREGTGSSEQAATAFEALITTLGNAKKIEKLHSNGVQIFDAKALKENEQVLRPINEIMVEIVKAAHGKKTLLSEVFDTEAMRAFNSAISEYMKTGEINRLDRFMKVQGDGSALLDDSTRAAQTASAALQNLYTAWQQFSDTNLTESIRDLADILNNVDSGTAQMALKGLAGAAGAALSIYAVRKTYGMYRGVKGLFGGGKSGGAASPLSGFSKAAPMPVYVVNGGLGMGGDVPGGGGKNSKGGKSAKVGKGLSARALRFGKTLASFAAPVAMMAVRAAAAHPVAAAVLTAGTIGKLIYDNVQQSNSEERALAAKQLAQKGGKEAAAGKSQESQSASAPNASLDIRVIAEGAVAKVQNLRADRLDVSVDTGQMMVGY